MDRSLPIISQTIREGVGSTKLLGKKYSEVSLKFLDQNLQIYPPLLSNDIFKYSKELFNDTVQPQISNLSQSLQYVHEVLKIDPYIKKFFLKGFERKELNNYLNLKKEHFEAINFLEGTDLSILFDPSNIFFQVPPLDIFLLNKKKEQKNYNFFAPCDATLTRSLNIQELVWYTTYTGYLMSNMTSLLNSLSKTYSFKEHIRISSTLLLKLIPYIIYSPMSIIPDTLHGFALASAFTILSHPFLIVDLGKNSTYFVLLEMTHSFPKIYSDLSLVKHIDTFDLLGFPRNQYLGTVPYIIKKDLFEKITCTYNELRLTQYDDVLFQYKEFHKDFLVNIIDKILKTPQSRYIDITNSTQIILKMLIKK